MIPGMEARKREKLLLFLGLSLLVHCLLMLTVYRLRLTSDLKIPDNAIFVDLDKLPLPIAQEKEKTRQVVESEVAEQSKPKDAKFLGERDQSVAEETKARQVESFRKGGAAAQEGQGGKPSMALKNLAPPKSKAFTPPTQAEIDGMKQRQKQQLAKKEYNAGGQPGAMNPGSATNDYLKDTKEGDRTLLNTKEFVYFSYYRRVRERLEVAWNNKLRATLGDAVYGSARRLASDRNYVTGLVVVLDRYGKITAIKVRQKSGVRDLDDAAVNAFNDAGPFPDPPAGLVDSNGQIIIPWDFVLQS